MNINKRTTVNTIIAILTVMLSVWPAFGQSVTLRGQVVDELNGIIPDAEIILIGADGKQQKTRSDKSGYFSIANVQAGTYTLTSSFKGFQTHVTSDLKVPVAGGSLKVTMTVAAVNVSTDVSSDSGGVSLENDQNMNATILGEEFIKGLPDNEDELREYLNALAGPSAAAGNGGGAQIMVDGFSGGKLPPKNAIAQIRINSNPFSAEFSRGMGGGRVEVITKPGYADWRGSGFWTIRNSALDARNAFASTKPDFMSNRFNFDLGGPVIKKKMSVFMNFYRDMSDGSAVTSPILDESKGIQSFNVPFESKTTTAFFNTDYLLNDKNTLKLSYDIRKTDIYNNEFSPQMGGFMMFGGGGFGGGFGGRGGGGGSGALNLMSDSGSSIYSKNHTFRFGETWIVNPKMIHEARFEFERESSNRIAASEGLSLVAFGSFINGGSTCCPSNSANDSYEYQDYLTYTSRGSKHNIKGGIQLQYDTYYDNSRNNFNGTFTFASLSVFNKAVASLSSTTREGIPGLQFTYNQGETLLDYGMFTGSWFINEDWKVKDNLQLSFGLRHEFQNHFSDKLNFAPRFGITWSPFRDKKTIIRAGGGIYYDRYSNGQYANILRYNGTTQLSFTVNNAKYGTTLAEAKTLNPVSSIPTESSASNVYLLGDNLKAPYDINAMVSVERQLPKGLVGTVSWFHSKGINQFRTRNINAKLNGVRFTDPTLGNMMQIESSADNKTDRLSFNVNKRMGKVMVFGGYNLSWIKSNGEGNPADNFNTSSEWGRSGGDSRHSVFTGAMITLPMGFRANTFIFGRSGSPFNITMGRDFNGDGNPNNDRPINPVTGQYLGRNSNLTKEYYEHPQFSMIQVSSKGTPWEATAQNITLSQYMKHFYPDGVTAEGPGFFNANLSISKSIGFGKSNNVASSQGGGMGGPGGGRGGGGGGMRGGGPMMMGGGGSENSRFNLTFQVSLNNVFNRVNYRNYQGTLGTALFNRSNAASEARRIEFTTRFNF